MSYKNQPHDLHEWLAIATRKLSSSAKERIRMEIEGHYVEAVEAHKAEGMLEVGARAMALADLGDAKAAHRRFAKKSLLVYEAKHLDYLLSKQRMKKCLKIGYAMFIISSIFAAGKIWNWRHDPSLVAHLFNGFFLWILCFCTWVALPTLSFRLSEAASADKKAPLIVLLETFGGFIPGLLIYQILLPKLSGFAGWVIMAPMSLSCLLNFWMGLRIWKKIRRA